MTEAERGAHPHYAIDPVRLVATKDGAELPLTYNELKVLAYFLSLEGAITTCPEIRQFCWGDRAIFTNIANVYLYYLRRKGVQVESVGHGNGCVGYRLVNGPAPAQP